MTVPKSFRMDIPAKVLTSSQPGVFHDATVRFVYSAYRPYEVKMVVGPSEHYEKTWVFAHSLLVSSSHPAGQGDVRVSTREDITKITLHVSGDSWATLDLPAHAVEALVAVMREARYGTELPEVTDAAIWAALGEKTI